MNCYELRSIRERCLHLNLMNHLRHTGHCILTKDGGAEAHQLTSGTTDAGAGRGGFRIIWFQASRLPFAGEIGGNGCWQFFLFARREAHGFS